MYTILGFIIGIAVGVLAMKLLDIRQYVGDLKIVRQDAPAPDDLYLFLELNAEPDNLLNKKKVVMNVKVTDCNSHK